MTGQTPAPARPWLPWAVLLTVQLGAFVLALATGNLFAAAVTALCAVPVAVRLAAALTDP
jgi:hypothetical protein